jgi:hypothetical protein
MISRADIISNGFSSSENLTEEDLLVKWMADRYHPFSEVEYASFREYITTLNPSAIIYSSRHCRSRIRQEPLIYEEE